MPISKLKFNRLSVTVTKLKPDVSQLGPKTTLSLRSLELAIRRGYMSRAKLFLQASRNSSRLELLISNMKLKPVVTLRCFHTPTNKVQVLLELSLSVISGTLSLSSPRFELNKRSIASNTLLGAMFSVLVFVLVSLHRLAPSTNRLLSKKALNSFRRPQSKLKRSFSRLKLSTNRFRLSINKLKQSISMLKLFISRRTLFSRQFHPSINRPQLPGQTTLHPQQQPS